MSYQVGRCARCGRRRIGSPFRRDLRFKARFLCRACQGRDWVEKTHLGFARRRALAEVKRGIETRRVAPRSAG